MAELFEVVGEGEYDAESDTLFLPDIEPEDIGWPHNDYFRELQHAEEDRRYDLIGDEFDDDYAEDLYDY